MWPADLFGELRGLGGDAGARRLLERYPERIAEVAVDHGGIHADVDAAADLERLRTGDLEN